ncbi:O-antigen polymerase [Vibrio natriegens]|uniref:O-antigen polymerase n=1 Tax=Vibrio natriegens TaxID=691 RepID=UPI003DA01B7F
MLIVTFLLLFFGLVFSFFMPRANPFKYYFGMWLLIVTLYLFSYDDWLRVDGYAYMTIIISTSFILLLMPFYYYFINNLKCPSDVPVWGGMQYYVLDIFLLITVVLLPFCIMKGSTIAGESVFSPIGYMKLRHSLVFDGSSFGIYAYVASLSMVIASVSCYSYFYIGSKRLYLTLLSVIVSILYCVMMTGRTYFLLLMCLVFIPLIIKGKIKLYHQVIVTIVTLCFFVIVSLVMGKGGDIDSTFSSNVYSMIENLRSYTVAPFVAFSELIKSTNFNSEYNETKYIFRTFYAVMHSLGIYDGNIVDLVREYSYTPYPTNVYTVFGLYYRDFGLICFIFPAIFMLFHLSLYVSAIKGKEICVFLYSASVYPLLMQFFQDQYFSLLSKWIQVCLFYVLFTLDYRKVLKWIIK